MFKFFAVLGMMKAFWPVALEAALYVADGKITKEEVMAIADDILGEDGVIYLWGKPNV